MLNKILFKSKQNVKPCKQLAPKVYPQGHPSTSSQWHQGLQESRGVSRSSTMLLGSALEGPRTCNKQSFEIFEQIE